MSVFETFGIPAPDLTRRFSISFIDSFASCSHKVLLSKLLKIRPPSVSIPATFGSAVHDVLHVVNKALFEKRDPCGDCPHNCRVCSNMFHTHVHRQDCPIKKLAVSTFDRFFPPDVIYSLVAACKDDIIKGKKISKKIATLRAMISDLVMSVIAATPYGEVLAAEVELTGSFLGHPFIGYPDLVLLYNNEVIILDYKTRGSKPPEHDFPYRQFTVYKKMCQEIFQYEVVKVMTIYVVTSGTGKIIPDVREFRDDTPIYGRMLRELESDMSNIVKCLTEGIFFRNRGSRYHPCQFKEFCGNDDLAIGHKFTAQETNRDNECDDDPDE